MDNFARVSIIVLTYNSNLAKLLLTLGSIIRQEGIEIQIVIADDGSIVFHENQIRLFFSQYEFSNYVIKRNRVNSGTVKNIISGLRECKYYYVKLISPGDLFADRDSIYEWVAFMHKQKADVSICRNYYYSFENDGTLQLYKKAFRPQKSMLPLKYSCLILNNTILGATVMIKTDILREYLLKLVDKIIYAEDFVYRLMLLDNLSISIYNKQILLYEFGTGISTVPDPKWVKRIDSDWRNINSIIYQKCERSSRYICREIRKAMNYRTAGKGKRLLLYITNIAYLTYKIKADLFPQRSKVNYTSHYFEEIRDNTNCFIKENEISDASD